MNDVRQWKIVPLEPTVAQLVWMLDQGAAMKGKPSDGVSASQPTEPWMASYAAIPKTVDDTDYIVTKVAAEEFQLYRHEAAHLHMLLGRALGVAIPLKGEQK